MPNLTVFIVSLVFLGCIVAAPLSKNEGTCKQGCPSTNKGSKLKYQPGQVYSYNFDSTVSISLTGNEPQDIQLQVQGTAHVHGISNCQYGLDLQDVTLIGPDKLKTKFNSKLQLSKIVQFTLADDKLEPEICTSTDDTDVSLNIKRALISLFQLNDASTDEIDVFGKCHTNYAVAQQEDGSYVVTKTRDLNACSYRENFVNGIISGVFNENSNVKSTPLLSGDYTNEIRVNKNGLIESAQVVEDYTLVPFQNGEAGLRARVVTALRFKEQQGSNGAERVTVSVPRPLIYETVAKPQAVNYKIAKKSLFDICDTYSKRKNSVGAQVAGQFTETIRLLRYLKKDDILLLFKEASQLKDNPVCRKVFLDAAFRVGTADSVNAIASLLENNKIHEKRLAYLSFNLASSVNKETLAILTKLLDKEHFKEGYLSVGNIVKKYAQNGDNDDAELNRLFDKLAEKLGSCKSEKRQQEDIIVAILKGLRGAKGVSGSLVDKLIACSNEGNAGRVRAAAIQALNSVTDDSKIQSAALNLLKNRKDDSEFRIEAYLVLVENSSPQVAGEILKLLEDEPVNQVGSFIVSHLANLRSSTDLYREKARKDFSDVFSSKKFPSDIRKFSFNHEFSYEFGSLGLGGSIDSNVIYSQKSFVPRSIRSNLTGEIFGTSFNFLEINARQENFDSILERYFGPKGYFNTLNKQDTIDKLHSMVSGDASKRHKRALAQDSEQFGKEYVGSSNRDADFDVSVKMFGSELSFLSLGDNFPAESKDFTKEFGKWVQHFLKASKDGKKNQYDVHSLFYDAEFSYPTSSGFPLKIQSQGAGAFHLEASLKADFKDIQSNPKNTKFSVSVVPSYNIEVTGTVSVDAYEVTTGVKVTSNVHSATGSQVSFELLKEGKGVDFKIDFPQKKQEILSFDHKIVFIQQNLGHESIEHSLKATQKKDLSDKNYCFDQVNKYLGVTVCFEYSSKTKTDKLINSRLFPLNGPLHVSAYVEIEKQYHFSALYDDSNPQIRNMELIFDTPNSQPNRKVSINFEGALNPKTYIKASINSPYKSANAEVGITNDEKELVLYGEAKSDSIQYLLKLGFQKTGSGARQEYIPLIQYNSPESIPYKVSGKIIVDKTQHGKPKYIFEKLTIEPAQRDGKFGPLMIDGPLELNSQGFDTALQIKYSVYSANIKGKVSASRNSLDADLSLLTDFNELANGRIKINHIASEKHMKNSAVLVYGHDLESTSKRLEFTTDYEYEKQDNKYTSVSGKNTFIISPIPVKLIVNGSIRKGHIDYELNAEALKHKISSNLNADGSKKVIGDWNVKFDAKANEHSIDFTSTRDIDAAQKSTVKHEIQSSFGTHVVINSKFDNAFSAQKADFVSDGTIVVARGQKPLKYDFKFLIQPKLAQTSGKVVADSAEVVSFNAVLNRNGGDANVPVTGKVDVSVPEFVTAHGDYQRLKGDGKMEFVLTFPKLKHDIKVDSKFSYGPNKLDLHNEFSYNSEKSDNSYLVAFDTKNKYTSTAFDSVNEININGVKYQFELDATRSGDYQVGKQNGKFVLRLPNQRELSGLLSRQTDFKSAKASGHGNIKLTDTVNQGGRKTRSFELDATLKDGNREQRLFDIIHKLTVTDFDGKQIVVDSHVNHLPKGDFKSALAAVKLSGSIPQPVEFSVAIKEYCAIHAVFSNNFKYGNTASLDLNGDYYVGEAGVKPTTFKLNGEVAIPQSKFKQLSFDTRGSLKCPNLKADPNSKFDYDFKFNGVLNEKNAAVDTKGKFGKSGGDLSLNVKLPEVEPFAADIDYNYDVQPEQYHGSGNMQVRYGNGKNIKFSGDGKVIDKEISFHGSINTPYEKAKTIAASFKSQKKDDHTYGLEAGLDIDDKKYKLSNAVVVSQLSPSFSLDLYYPQDKHSKIAIVTNRVGDHKYKLSVHLENIQNLNLNGDVELSYYSFENFGLVFDLDAPALKANKLHVDIHTKQNGNNKGIEFVVTEQNKNIISGTADYSIKQEKGKTTIEGKGNVNWYDKTSTLTFQFMRSTFNQAENNETGVSLVFNGQIGPKNVQAELKLTNREFHLQHTICESDKPCIHLKVESSLNDLEWKRFTHNLLVSVDLRPIGFAHEFNLKAYTKRDGYAIEHTFDTQIQTADQHKYQFNAYVKPQQAGIALSIPKRIAAVEAVFAYPKDFVGVYQVTITSYLDKKNDPSKHSTIGFRGEVKHPSKYTFVAMGALVASHPSVKDLKITGESEFNGEKQLVSGNIKFDVFKNTNQAIIVAAKFANTDAPSKGFNVTSEISLKSQGLGLNYAFTEIGGVSYGRRAITYVYELRGPTTKDRFGVYLNADLKKVDASIVVFNEDMLKGVAQIDSNKRQLSLQTAAKLLDSDPVNVDLAVSLRSANALIKQGNFISIEADAALGKALSLKAHGNQRELINVNVALDQAHLFSTTYNVNDKDFREFLKNARAKLIEDGKRARNGFETRINQAKQSLTTQVNSIKDNLPDFTRLNADYKEEFEKFSEDLLADKSIKELVDLFNNTYKSLNKTVGELLRTLMAHFQQITKTITDFFKSLYDGFNERILPSLKESYNQIEKVLMDLFDEILAVAANLFERLVESLKKFEKDFKQLSQTISETSKKVNKFLSDQFEVFQRELEDLYKLIVDYLKSLPGFDVLKEKYQELLQRIPHSDSEELKKYFAEAVKKVKEWIDILQKQFGALGIESIEDYYNLPMLWVQKNVQLLPQLSTLKFSIVNYALHEPLPSPKDLLLTYRPYAFNPLYFVPPFPIEGHIVGGEQLFTFAGDQISLPGSCHYVLAKDMVDGNFTVIAKINDKKLQSIAIADKSGESIEISESGKVSVNNKPTEFPVHEQTLFAWRTYYSVSLLSTYGVHIQCRLDLQTCNVKINGYYFSKLRGLLGKGGYEQFDAHTLPNGKVSESLSQFANAYRLHSCPEVTIDEHHSHADDTPSAECENVFGPGSPLRFGKYILDPSKYIQACNHAVKNAANKQEAACRIAFGYAAYGHGQNIPLKMPDICQKCEVTDDSGAHKSYEIGEGYKVNAGKKADIVFVVDTALESKSLKELVQHFIAELRHPLKKEYDTKISVLGYKKGNRYFSHYTSDGQLDVEKFHLARKPEHEVQEEKLISVGCKHLDPILQSLYNASIKVQDELSLLADGRAFREALTYPFRSNAHRTIIAIRSDVLQHSSNPIKLLGAKAVNEIAKSMGINIHLLGPMPDLNFDNNKEINNVVGFNDKSVLYMPGQRVNKQDREHLQYGLDLGIDMIGENHGYAFSLNNYNALSAPEQRKFLKVAAQTITQQITKEDSVHDCVCTLYRGLFAREVCRASDQK